MVPKAEVLVKYAAEVADHMRLERTKRSAMAQVDIRKMRLLVAAMVAAPGESTPVTRICLTELSRELDLSSPEHLDIVKEGAELALKLQRDFEAQH